MAICNWCGDEDTTDVWKSHICVEPKEDQDRPFTVGDMKRALQGLDDDIQILIGGDEGCNFDWANLNLDYKVPNEKEGYMALTFFIKNNYNTWQF